MARARNIKPALFKNEILGVADPLYTLLFEGLWLLADREGRLEDRPLRIKAEVFPYRDGIDINTMIDWLQESGFIKRYAVDGKRYIQILNFAKHQNPHKNEPASEIPEESKVGIATEKIGATPEDIGSAPADSLFLDSGFRIPDSISADGGDAQDEAADAGKKYPAAFEEAWSAYPKRPGMSKGASHKAWAARVKSGVDPGVILDGVRRYAKFCADTEKVGTEYVKQPATFFGPDEHYAADWTAPKKLNGASKHGNFEQQDYRAGVTEDGRF